MVDIILATYNGERFLRQQLYSLMAQTYGEWRCVIHDDGSSDNTIEIIKEFCKKDNRFVFIDYGIILQDACKNFLQTLKYSNADFLLFSDQDDVWLDTKIEKLLEVIKNKDNAIPQVVLSNAYLWENKRNYIYGQATLAFPNSVETLLFLNAGIQGASAIFNKKMLEILRTPIPCMVMHDYYLTLAGVFLGEIDYLHENLMLYRQHEKNVTGHADASMFQKIKYALSRRKNALVSKQHLKSLESFLDVWSKRIPDEELKKAKKFISMTKKNFLQRLFFLLGGDWKIYDSRIKLLLKFFLRPYLEE